jgi:hypothetical protein
MPPVFRFQRRQGYLQPGGEPQNNQALRSHSKDPSSVRVAPFAPDLHPDQAQFAKLRQQMDHGEYVELRRAEEAALALNMPPQIRQAPKVFRFTANNVPQLMLPRNRERMAIIVASVEVSGANGGLFFSFDPPVGVDPVSGLLLGIPVLSQQFYQETNGSVSMNDVWVWTNNQPANCLCYEGILALEGKTTGAF